MLMLLFWDAPPVFPTFLSLPSNPNLMKKLLESIPVTRALLIAYIILFIVLGTIRFAEHSNIRKITDQIHLLTNTSTKRQNFLAGLQNCNDLLRVTELRLLSYANPNQVVDFQHKIGTVRERIDGYLMEYRKFIIDSTEQQLYDSILVLQNKMRRTRDELTMKFSNGNINLARSSDSERVQPDFEILRSLNQELSGYVYQRDVDDSNKLEEDIAGVIRSARILTLVIAFLIIVLGILVIVTVRAIVRKRNRLAVSESRYRTFIEETNELITELSPDGYIRFANRRFKELMGYEESELMNLKVFDLMTEESAIESKMNLMSGGKDGAISKVSRIMLNKNGQRVFIEGNVAWQYKDGRFDGITGFFQDVTDQKLLEISLKESELKFRQLFYMAPIPMYTFDPETKSFLSVNDAALNYYGYTEAAFLKKTILDIRPKEEVGRTMRQIDLIVEENKKHIDYYKHLLKDGTVTDVEIFASRILLDHKPVILASVIDVTERKQNENRITQAIIKTQEEERYEIGSELHDNVCQLLASAKMSMGMMKNKLPKEMSGPYTQSLESIVLATEEIRNLSHRLAPVFFQNTTLKESFERLLSTFNIGSDYSIALYFDKAVEELPMSHELQLNLYRILQEQLRNILKYANASEITLDILFHRNQIKMLIADNGVGFDTTTTVSGIGLANMKRRAEFFGGSMELSSAPGVGCEIIVTIPWDRNAH